MTNLSPEMEARIKQWASENAATEEHSFDETRYIGLIDGAWHMAEKAEELQMVLENNLTGADGNKYAASDAYFEIAKMLLGNQPGSAIEALQDLQNEVNELRTRAVHAEREAQQNQLKLELFIKDNKAKAELLAEALETIRNGKSSLHHKFEDILTNTDMALIAQKALSAYRGEKEGKDD